MGMFIKLRAADGFETGPFTEKENRLEWLQKQVGGYIETISLPGDFVMILNEEGKINKLPLNHAATNIAVKVGGYADLIVGDVLILKENGEEFTGMDKLELAGWMGWC